MTFFAAGDRRVLDQFEAVVDAVIAGERGSERGTRLELPRLAALQLHRIDVGRGEKRVRYQVIDT